MQLYRLVIIAICILLVSSTVAFAKSGVPAGSFVKQSINSVDDLVAAVKSDDAVARRYANHFGMTVPELIEYFENDLTLVNLDKPGIYTTYYVGRGGRVVSRTARLGAGQKVFVAHDGTPVISVRCGNPISKELPEKPIEKALAPKTYGLPDSLQAELISFEQEPEMNPLDVVMEPQAPETVWQVASAPSMELGPLSSAIIPAIIGGAIVTNKGGEPVPEPSSLLVMIVGGVPMAGYFIRKRRQG